MSAQLGVHAPARRDIGWIKQLAFEIATCGALYLLYRQVRVVVRHQELEALSNSGRVISFERAVGFFNEVHFQRLLVGDRAVMWVLDRYYVVMHFTVTVVGLVWAYTRHRTTTYRRMKFLLAGATFVALVLHVSFPLAPPRMLPDLGFVDTLARYGPRIYSRDPGASVANQFAAMPSLHFGWSLIIAWCVASTFPHRRWVKLVWLHPAVTLTAIVATGNHYWLDAIVAGALVLAAEGVWRLRGVIFSRRASAPPMVAPASMVDG